MIQKFILNNRLFHWYAKNKEKYQYIIELVCVGSSNLTYQQFKTRSISN